MLRGWERTIDKALLYQVLANIKSEDENLMVLALPSFLDKKGIRTSHTRLCLVLVIKNKTIVTGYWCKCINKKINNKSFNKCEILY